MDYEPSITAQNPQVQSPWVTEALMQKKTMLTSFSRHEKNYPVQVWGQQTCRNN
jgi:hypothetical protein